MAIDYGQKRAGLAVSDTLQLIANGLTTEPSDKVVDFLVNYTLREAVDLFVVGYPKQLNNEPSENLKRVEAFVKRLCSALPCIPVAYCDERFTSTLARRAMLDGGLRKKKRQNKALVDEISAVFILQSYLESTKYKKI